MIGVLVAAAIAYGMYAGAIRINLAKFFKYTGVFLIVVAAGILSYGVGALQTVGWLPGLAPRPSTSPRWFNWSSWYGEVIQGIFNVTPDADRAAVRRVAGLPRRRAGDLPAPDRRPPAKTDPSTTTAYPNPERSTT